MNIELDRIYNMDCLEGMKAIPDGSVDAVICDLPYGTMKGIVNAPGWDNCSCEWDEIIPTDRLFAEYARIIRRNGVTVLFSMEPYTSHLRQYKGQPWMEFCYPMIWRKDSVGNALMSKTAPVSVFEDISVFKRTHDIDENMTHPLRDYSRKLISFIGKSAAEIMNDIRSWNIETPHRIAHFLRPDGLQFRLCTEETYDILIERYGIDKMEGFRTYEDLKAERDKYNDEGRRVFNLPEGQAQMLNVLDFKKDPREAIHPTQKPVALIRRLVLTYTNEGDTVLDNCMGSGTTAIACIKEKRHFIGFELSKEYFDKAVRRIKAEQAQLTLF